MRIKVFAHPRLPLRWWEINFIGRRLNVRLSPRQVALWRDCIPLTAWLADGGFYGRWLGTGDTSLPAPR